MGYGGKRDWKAADGGSGLALARSGRRRPGCAGKSGTGKGAGDRIFSAHGRKPFWAESRASDARRNVRSAQRARGDGKPPPRNAPSRVVHELKLTAGFGADHARSL